MITIKTNTMKKLAIIIFGVLFSINVNAQGKYGATPEDSVTCINNLIYKDYLKSDPKLALKMWKIAYKVCPGSQKSLYINGASMYKSLADNAKDEAVKEAFLDTMFSIRSEEHTSELQSRENLVCRLLLEKKNRRTSPFLPS